MSKREKIIKEIEQIPETILDEVTDFTDFLRMKAERERMYAAVASEPLLEKDWMRPEEDQAWKNL